ncbi:HpcH/HpaI aldolase/citrate lyase family protein [candidate division KSB1 bacterium]|nr:HpcH/HpaI aldolase/citrate lyase family protein [candidate division KSB1 bacterium]
MNNAAHAGRRGNDVRSDCWVEIKLNDSGGRIINLNSKVESMYGQSIRDLVTDMLNFYGIEHADITIEDNGALPFVLRARIETAIRRADASISKAYLPTFDPSTIPSTSRDRFRRSRLYLPGNEPKFMINAALHHPDGIILDLEDSVSPSEKDAAAVLVRNALCAINFGECERMVRINQLPAGLDDLLFVIPYGVHVILIPKCELTGQVHDVDRAIYEIKRQHNISHDIFLMPIVESAAGVMRAFEIACASPHVVALTIGLEDYTADIGTQRTVQGQESLWARSMVINAARAAGVQPIDSVFSDVGDMDGLRQSVLEAKALGFDGKGCIHPRQIAVIHDAFAPATDEIEKATRIVRAFENAEANGLGVVSLGSKMIDPPVVKRALRTVKLAIATGKLSPDWREGGV